MASTSSSTSSTESELDRLEVGRVARPHGLRGQVVVELISNRAERMTPGSRLEIEGGTLEVRHASRAGQVGGRERWLVQFDGVDDREAAEQLREAVLWAEPLPDDGAWWVHELVGSEVVDADGAVIGRVAAVQANPASDLLVLDDSSLIPLRFVVDRQPGRLVTDLPPGLLDL